MATLQSFDLWTKNVKAYQEAFDRAIDLEIQARREALKKLSIYNTKITRVRGRQSESFRIHVPGLKEKSPRIVPRNTITIEFIDLEYTCRRELIVKKIHDENPNVEFKRDRALENMFLHHSTNGTFIRCNVFFNLDTLPFIKMKEALSRIDFQFFRRLCPTKVAFKIMSTSAEVPHDHGLVLFQEEISSNKEQLQAIWHIVNGSSGPYPYVLFGPPGTGKTKTIVEAILQVWNTIPGSRVLVCAPSNAATDVLALRLVDYIPLVRLLSFSRKDLPIDKKLKDIVQFPSEVDLFQSKVLVVTLGSSHNISAIKDHFTHVFIDEAGQATEPESLIALVGISKTTRIILSGDPHQLGPVVTSNKAENLGLGKSMLERLMERSIYKRDEEGYYDPRIITKLVKNFRSHSKLIEVPSKLFYHNKLEACADETTVERLLLQLNLHFPVNFYGVLNAHERHLNSTSLLNNSEIKSVLEFIKQFVLHVDPSEIGIISPYKAQVSLIKEALKKEKISDKIEVGTTETFQGQEKQVIILSTVRSSLIKDGSKGLGFLSNKKRFNVAITRAKYLLIVIGDPFLLQYDSHWNNVLQFALKNGSYCGVTYDQTSFVALPKMIESLKLE